MSDIIECPACSTRYRLNKSIPEEGRHVKCARCEHQWFLVPESEAFEQDELEDPGYDQDAAPEPGDASASQAGFAGQAEDSDWARAPESEDAGFDQGTDAAPVRDWQARRDRFASAISTLSEPQSMDYASEGAAPGATAPVNEQGWVGGNDEDWPDTHEEENWPDVRDIDANRQLAPGYEAAKPPFSNIGFDAFNVEDNAALKPEEEQDSQASRRGFGWASRFMPWRSKAAPADEVNAEEAEEGGAESTIRRALKAAMEHQGEEPGHRQEFRQGFGEDVPADAERQPRLNRFADEEEAEDSDPFRSDAVTDGAFAARDQLPRFSFADFRSDAPSFQDADSEEDDADPPFRLTGKHANAPIYNSGRDGADPDAARQHYGIQSDTDVYQDDIGSDLGERATGEESGQYSPNEPPNEYDNLYDQDLNGGDGRRAVSDLDDDLAALQAQLGMGDLTRYERKNR